MATKLTIPLGDGSKYECEAKPGVGAKVQDCLRQLRRSFKDAKEVELFMSLTCDSHREAFVDFIRTLGRSFKNESESREFFLLNNHAQRQDFIHNLMPKSPAATPQYLTPGTGVRAYA